MTVAGPASIEVLLVDDEPDFARLVAEHLAATGGDLDVAVETEPRDAIDRLDGGSFDCVVSDYEMPGLDGLELLETVRREHPDLPFILFTGQGSETIASEAISAGVTEYMQKGTDPEQYEVLANRIRNAVGKYHTERELERAETRYRRLVEQNLTGIYIIRDAEIEYANPTAAEIFGYEPEELMALSAFDVVAEQDHERLRRNIEKRESGEQEAMNYTLTGVRKSGERFEFEVHSGRIDYGGEPAILGSLIDVTEQRERERELEEYRELFETVGDPMYVLSADGHFEKVNAAMAGLLGYDREEMIGAPASRFLPDDDAERSDRLVRSFIEGSAEPPETIEVEVETVDGGRVPCEANVTTLEDEDGFRGSVGVVRVIAERKERERELEEYETIVETAPDGVFIIDDEGVIRSGNRPGAELMGFDRESLLGESYETLVEEGVVEASFAEQYMRTIDELLARDVDNRKAKLETTLDRPDGTRRAVEIHISPLVTEEGFRGTVGILRDVTERRKRERRLSALHEATRRLMEATSREEVIDIGLDAAEEVLGLEVAAVYGRREDRLVPLAATDGARNLFGGMPSFDRGEGVLWEVYETGKPLVTEDFRKRGVIFDPATPVRSELVLPVGDHGVFMAASEDVGAFDEADESLAKVLASNVEAAIDRAERETLLREREQALLRQNERLEEFAGVVSHDLRSPLTVAKGNVYLLRERGEIEYLDEIEGALQRMEELIDDLLTLARQGETVDETEPVEVESVAREAWTNVDTAAAELAVESGSVEADPGRLQQMLENLFRNAVEHGGESVDVRVGFEDDCMYVSDDGEGIPEDDREELFAAGYSTAEEGTGFGLSIVKQIAEAHGWEVSVAESEAGGARFEFSDAELPVVQPAD